MLNRNIVKHLQHILSVDNVDSVEGHCVIGAWPWC